MGDGAAFDVLGQRFSDAGEFAKGIEQIKANDSLMAPGVGGDSRASHDERHSNAGLPDIPFAALKQSAHSASVVGHVDDVGVVPQSQFVEAL